MEVTPDHPLYIEGRGWVAAEDVAVGDSLRRKDGGFAQVLSIERVILDEPEWVYNFTVRGLHTYFVLEAEVLVHNCGGRVPLKDGADELPEGTKWVDINDVTPTHEVNFNKKTSIVAYRDINKNGFDPKTPIILVRDKGGELLVRQGHHRLATVGLGEFDQIPAIIQDWSKVPASVLGDLKQKQFFHARDIKAQKVSSFFIEAEYQARLKFQALPRGGF